VTRFTGVANYITQAASSTAISYTAQIHPGQNISQGRASFHSHFPLYVDEPQNLKTRSDHENQYTSWQYQTLTKLWSATGEGK
jgi:hypothetical protein